MKQILHKKYILPDTHTAYASNYSLLRYLLPAFFMFFLAVVPASAQLTKIWETPPLNSSEEGSVRMVAQAVDPEKNLIIIGETYANTSSRKTVIYKVDQGGNILWSRMHTGEAGSISNYPVGLWVDSNGNSYILATTDMAGAYKSTLIRYSASGALVWSKTLEYGSLLKQESVTVGADNGVYVSGYRFIDGKGYVITQKWNSDGNVVWTSQYEPQLFDRGGESAIAVDDKGAVYVVNNANGYSSVPNLSFLKYNAATGSQLLFQQFGVGTTRYTEFPKKIMVSPSGMVYTFTNISGQYYDELILYVMTAAGTVNNRVRVGEGQEYRYNPIFYLQEAAFTQDESLILLCKNAKYRTTADYFIAKHSKDGSRQWIKSFNINEGGNIRQFAPSSFTLIDKESIALWGSYSFFTPPPAFYLEPTYIEEPKATIALFDQNGNEFWRDVNQQHSQFKNYGFEIDKINSKSVYATVYVNSSPVANHVIRYQDCSGLTASAGADKQICAGGSVQLQATGGTSYSWSPATGLSATNVANPTASPGQTTTYTVTVTNADGCSATDQVVVTVNPTPTAKITAGGETTFCTGGSVVLTADAGTGYSYQWLRNGATINGATTANYTATTAGNYTVVVNAGGCSATSAAVTVNVTNGVTASAGQDKTICAGGSAQLQASGGTSYSWSPTTGLSAANVANPTASPAQTTTYTVTISNGSGCSATDQVTVTVNPAPAATITASGPTTFCEGSSVTLTANSGAGLTYQWLQNGNVINNATGNSFTTQASGDYAVRITNSSGCTATSAVTKVTVTTPPTVNAGQNQSICVNATALTLTGFSPAGGTWSGPGVSANGLFNPTTAGVGTYTLTYTVNQNSCSVSATKTITVTQAVASSAGTISGETTTCAGTTNLTYSVPAVTGATSYTWTVPNGYNITAGQGTRTITVTAGNASGSISVKAQNDCGSSEASTIAVNVSSAPAATITAGGNTAICPGSSVTLTANSGSGYSYQWLRNGSAISNATSNTYTANSAGDYAVIVRNAGGCSATSTAVRVTAAAGVTASAGENKSICAGGNVQLQASGGTTYSWSPATGLSATNIANPIASPAQTTTYTVTVRNASGCTDTDQVTVTVGATITASITATGSTSFCEGGSVTLQATTGNNYSYQWQRNGSDISGATAATYNATTAGSYRVIISSGSCNGTAQAVTVNVSSNISSNSISTGNQTVCSGVAVQSLQGSTPTGGSGNYSYQWQQSTDGNSYTNIQGATSQNYNPGNLSATTWFRRVVTSGSCSSTSEAVKITLTTGPTVSLGAFEKTCVQGTAITLSGGQPAGGTYSGPGVSNGVFNPATAGAGTHTITYTYTDGGNCSGTATQTIVVEAACAPTGVEDNEPPHKFVMFPNPAKDKLYLEVELPQRTDATLRLVDARGSIILKKEYKGQTGSFEETIQLDNMARGMYILQFTTKDGMYSRRVVLW